MPENNIEGDGYLKARQILAEFFSSQGERINSVKDEMETADAIKAALASELGTDRAEEMGFHLSHCSGDAAFILALHLFPQRFTGTEIEEGIRNFLIHAPNHFARAADLMGYPVSNIFEDDEK